MKNLTPQALWTTSLVVLLVAVAAARSYLSLAMATRLMPQLSA